MYFAPRTMRQSSSAWFTFSLLLLLMLTPARCRESGTRNRRAGSSATRFKKSWDEQQHLLRGYRPKICSNMRFWDFQIGSVSVLAFFDAATNSSRDQSVMLRNLTVRMDRKGLRDIQYFVINAARDQAAESSADYYEDERSDFFDRATDTLIESLGPDIMFTQDNSDLQIWDTLDIKLDQIIILDRCGRLTFEIFAPWSSLEFSYIKASILATFVDEPCGYCEMDAYSIYRQQFIEHFYSTRPDENQDAVDSNLSAATNDDRDDMLTSATTATDDTSHTAYNSLEIDESPTVVPISVNHAKSANRTADAEIEENEEPQQLEIDNESVLNESFYDTTTSSSTLPDGTREEETTQLVTEEPETLPTTDETTLTWETDKSIEAVTEWEFSSGAEETTSFESFASTTMEDDSFETSPPNDSFPEHLNVEESTEVMNTTEFDALLETDYTSQSANLEFVTTDAETSTEPIDVTTVAYDNSSPQDLQKSRSTNARSVLNEISSDNKLEPITNQDEFEDAESFFKSEFLIPVRIIMRAPHTHKHNEKSKKEHEYLVLKTGVPDYHAHLQDDAGSPITASPTMDGEQYKYRHDATDRSGYGKDEHPGIYGELFDDLKSGELDPQDDNDLIFGNSGIFFESMSKGIYEGAETPEVEPLNDDDIIDEESKFLMQHYAKIIPWLSFPLDN